MFVGMSKTPEPLAALLLPFNARCFAGVCVPYPLISRRLRIKFYRSVFNLAKHLSFISCSSDQKLVETTCARKSTYLELVGDWDFHDALSAVQVAFIEFITGLITSTAGGAVDL